MDTHERCTGGSDPFDAAACLALEGAGWIGDLDAMRTEPAESAVADWRETQRPERRS